MKRTKTPLEKDPSHPNLKKLGEVFPDIASRERSDALLKAQLRLIRNTSKSSVEEVLELFLDEAEDLTSSEIGFFHFVMADQKTLELMAWSKRTRFGMCMVPVVDKKYTVDKAGIWIECLKQAKPVVHNDYPALKSHKGLPEGHVSLSRELTVPIIRHDLVKAILGVGNKRSNYTSEDVAVICSLAEWAWEIVERKLMEEALVENEKLLSTIAKELLNEKNLLRTVVDNIPVLLSLYDVKTQMYSLNREFEMRIGWSTKEARTINLLEEIYPDPEDRSKAQKYMDQASREWKELVMTTKSGDKMASEWSYIRLEDGTHIGIGIDLSERKKSQAKIEKANKYWNTTFNSISDAVAILDENQQIIQTNQAFQEFFSLPESELVGKKCYSIVHGEDCAIDNCPFMRMLHSGQREKMDLEVGKATYEVVVDPILSSHGRIQGAVHVMTDITTRKEAERAILEAKAKAEESDRLKSAFLANMSHEIRTPLNGILGFMELLEDQENSLEDQQNYIRIIRNSSDRLLQTINNIIDISKIEARQMKLKPHRYSIREKLNDFYCFFLIEAKKKNLKLEIEIDLPPSLESLWIDGEKMDAIVTNFIKNAIKYTNEGTVTIQCRIQSNRLLFQVTDTGIGITEQEIPKVFDRFIQVHDARHSPKEGSGLGLAICKGYADLMEADIGVLSEMGRGSTFYFRLPIPLDFPENA